MKPLPNFKDVTVSMSNGRLPNGGYVLKINEVEDDPKKEYLRIVYDVAEGPRAKHYSDEWGKANAYAHTVYRSYKEKARGMFKEFLVAVDESNGTKFAKEAEKGLDEKKLVGKLFGAVIGEEEYKTDRGDVKTRQYIAAVMSADRIRAKDFTIPAFKALKEAPTAKMTPAPDVTFVANPLSDDDLPF